MTASRTARLSARWWPLPVALHPHVRRACAATAAACLLALAGCASAPGLSQLPALPGVPRPATPPASQAASPAAVPAVPSAPTPAPATTAADAGTASTARAVATPIVLPPPLVPAAPDLPLTTSAPAAAAIVLPSAPVSELQRVETEPAIGRMVTPVAPPVDLWQRIRAGYGMPDLDNELVRAQERWYATRPDYIKRMTERSRKYLFHIVEELEARKMPTELALLPFIESAFNPQAMSVARAAGMWQFIPSTGRDFDLKQNLFRDDRRDVLASTRAALDYLQKLYGMFGDWHLALAAYNWGEGSVSRAVARNQREGLGTSYVDLRMPNETRNYVPKLQAVKNIVTTPEAFNLDIPAIDNHPYFQTVTLKRDIDVHLAARLAGVSLDDFKALNPSANRPVIIAAGTPQILLPWDNATVFERNLEAHQAGQLATWTAWTVPATMSVAALAQKVGMSEGDLRSINQIPPRMMVRSGSTLLVRRPQHQRDDVAEALADNAQLSLAPEARTRKVVLKASGKETVASVAARYRVSALSVAEWNGVDAKAAFRPGQSIVVHLPAGHGSAHARGKSAVRKDGGAKPGTHRKGTTTGTTPKPRTKASA